MINKLTTLYELQQIDDQLDELEELRGDLPYAVNELKGQMQLLEDQIKSKEEEKTNSLARREQNDEEKEILDKNLTKFKSQLYNVRNNKEYDALTKEIDHSESEINRFEEENLSLEDLVERLKMDIEEISPQLEYLQKQLDEKEQDLKQIIKANEKEEVKLREKRDKIADQIRKNDYNVYMRIRKARNGKAVVTVERSACSGCHNVVPPQRQIEIRQSRRLFTCEFCGRILISKEIADSFK